MAILGGLLATAVTEVRSLLDEPPNSAKLPNDTVLARLSDGFSAVYRDLDALTEAPQQMSMDYTLTDGVVSYNLPLPVTATTVEQVVGLNSNGTVIGLIGQRRAYDSLTTNYGFLLRGPYLSLERPSSDSLASIRVVFRPGGYLPLHFGTLPTGGRDTTAGTWIRPRSGTVTAGQRDTRVNAYVGAWFRAYAFDAAVPATIGGVTYNHQNVTDEQIISAYTAADDKATLKAAMTLYPAGFANLTYEIVPTTDYAIWRAVVLYTARFMSAAWGRRTRMVGLQQEYQAYMRTLRMNVSQANDAYPNCKNRRMVRSYIW